MKYSFKNFFFAAGIFLFLFDFSSCVIEPRPCKITYKSSYGNPPKTKKIPINTILTEEELPELFSEDYTFEGWYDGEVKAEPGVYKITTNVCFVAKWEKIPTFEYKVYHWQENLEDNEYSLYKTETLYGKADYLTQATAINYEGFTSQDFEQKTITDDNKTEINIYYDRKYVTFTFENDDGSLIDTLIRKYWTPIEQPTNLEKEGFDFLRWEPELPDTFSGEDRTFVAKWVLEGVIVTDAYNVADTILALQGEGPHNIMVEGNIYSSTIRDIANALRDNSSAKVNLDLSIAKGLSVFPANYFSTCNIGTLILPETITSIEGRFQSTKNLQSITIPENVYSFDAYIFAGCTQLTEIIVDPDNQYYSSSDDRKILLYKDKPSIHSYPSASGDITIPNYITSIGIGAFSRCENLTSVIIPNSVTDIGYEAFFSCTNLETAQLPDTISTIEMRTFFDCEKLTNIEIPDTVTSIEQGAFVRCSSLTNIEIPDSVTSIGEQAFLGCSGLTNITIPNSVTSIGSNAFSDCTSLTSVKLSDSITSIESYTFAWCYNLTDITIPDGITLIGSGAFQECHALTNINLPDSITTIESNAFHNCYNLESINIPNNVNYIGSDAFYNCKISEVTLPDSITTIGYRAYVSCTNLTTINIPASVTSIESAAFQGCINLTTFKVDPNNQYYSTSDDNSILYNKDKTTLLSYPSAEGEISIPSTVQIIGDGAFAQSLITKIELHSSITSIGNSAFENCNSLTEINIPYGVTSIGDNAFGCCHYLENISIPASVNKIESNSFRGCWNLKFAVESTNNYYTSSTNGEMLLDKDKSTLLSYPSASGDVELSENITHIGDYAFYQCSNLNSIKLPDSVTTIGFHAFFDCNNLTSVELSSNLTSIQQAAFNWCQALTNIVLPDGLVTIEPYAFYYCTSLENITIPASVTRIGNLAFYECYNLQTVTFEDTNDWYYTYNSDYSNGSEIDVTDEYRNASYLRFNYEWNWYKGVGF